MTRYFVGIGSNDNAVENCTAMIKAIASAFQKVCVSTVVRSPACGVKAPDYLNAVVSFESSLESEDVQHWCKSLERRLGRTRNADGICQADLDILEPDNVSEVFFQPLIVQLQNFLQGIITRVDVSSVVLDLNEKTRTGFTPCFVRQVEMA